MSRVFTLNFTYKERVYTALISFHAPGNGSYHVRYLDEELNEIIAANKLVVNVKADLFQPKPVSKKAAHLIYTTTEAIKGYLDTHKS